MSYDPQWPQNGQLVDADRFRGQFSGLKDLIDALNVILAAQVDAVNTINHNEPATATVNLVGNTLHFSFDIPRGGVGAPGQDGIPGLQGPPFAQAIIDAVNTLNAGESATVNVFFDGSNVRFTFGIPRGNDGGQGGQGEQGIQGPPGEVTTNDLNAAIGNTLNQSSANTNGVSTLDTPFADPDAESIRQAYNALVLGLRRT